MTGLLVNMNLWKSLLKHREFDAAVDHVAVAQIMKAKTEPATTRIMRLLDRLSAYSFNLYYVKGRNMILANYLSRHSTQDRDPSELIPISFCSLEIYRSMIETGDYQTEKYHIHTRVKVREAGETIPDVHGAHKPIDPSYKPEHQSKSKLESVKANHSIVDGSARSSKGKARKAYPEKQVGQCSPVKTTPRRVSISPNEPEIIPRTTIPRLGKPYTSDTPLNTGARSKIHRPDGSVMPPIPSLPPIPPLHLPQPNKILSSSVLGDYGEDVGNMTVARAKCCKILNPQEIEGIDTGNTEEVLAPEIRIPTESDFELPPPLQDVVDPSKITHKFLPKQGDIDRLLSKINKKVLRDTNLSLDLRDLRAAYVTSPHFKDIYLHLTQNKMPIGKIAARWLDNQARNYMILDGLLFKIIDEGEGNLDTVLCIPTSKVNILLDLYHSSLVGGHTGITKCYHTISKRFYCPNLAENLRAYITGCHICQMYKKGKSFQQPYEKRMNINVPTMTRLSMEIKQMTVNGGYSHILVLLYEVTNFMVALLLRLTRTQHILDMFQKGYLAYFGPPTHIVCDQDPAFTSSLMEAFVTHLNIKVILVSPTNHKSLQAEHGIKSLSGLLVKHLSEVWSWPNILPYSMMCYNGYSTPNLNGYSPYELVFGHKMTLSHELEVRVDTVISGTFKEYYEKLKKNLQYMAARLQKFRSQRLDMLNRDREYQAYQIGQIVYMYQARGSVVQTGSRKIACYFVGPLIIYKAIGPNQFLLMSLDGQIYPHLIEQSRLKPGTIWTSKGNVSTLAQLRQALSTGLPIREN